MAETKYCIKDAILKTAPHHASFKALWETKWKAPVRGPYCFQMKAPVH